MSHQLELRRSDLAASAHALASGPRDLPLLAPPSIQTPRLHLQLPLLLLLFLIAGSAAGYDSSSPPPSPPLSPPTLPPAAQRLIAATRAGVCPCAYLERGGFWSGQIAARLGIANGVYVESRCRCRYEFNCARRWQQSSKSITVTWIGSYGVRASQIQLQFCSAIYQAALATCSPGEVTFSLRQMGWWVDLQGVFCRCPISVGTPTIHSFIYARPVAYNDSFNGRLVDFVCDGKRVCQADDWCYQELLNPKGRLTHGKVMCTCQSGAFCPIYHIAGGARVPMYNGTAESQNLIGYRLRCRLESQT